MQMRMRWHLIFLVPGLNIEGRSKDKQKVSSDDCNRRVVGRSSEVERRGQKQGCVGRSSEVERRGQKQGCARAWKANGR